MSKKVLIAGANGLIGKELTKFLLKQGCEVSWLTRKINSEISVKQFLWNPTQFEADDKAFNNIDIVINLAGAGIADKRWTKIRKEEIISSRVNAVKTIGKYLNGKQQIKLINASAIGYYGNDNSAKIFTENDKPGNDFMAHVCAKWEQSINEIKATGITYSIIRIGVVFTTKGGAFPKLIQPIKWGAGCVLGKGNQIISWIHLDDLLTLFLSLINDTLPNGTYNAVAPQPISNKEFMFLASKALNKKIILPPVPEFALRLALGEMADVIVNGNYVSAKKLIDNGFKFTFNTPEEAIIDLVKR